MASRPKAIGLVKSIQYFSGATKLDNNQVFCFFSLNPVEKCSKEKTEWVKTLNIFIEVINLRRLEKYRFSSFYSINRLLKKQIVNSYLKCLRLGLNRVSRYTTNKLLILNSCKIFEALKQRCVTVFFCSPH